MTRFSPERTNSTLDVTMAPTPEEEIDRFLRTGDHDLLCEAWPGGFSERARRAHEDLQNALVAKTRRLAAGKSPPAKVPNLDLRSFTRGKVEPMVRGLFPARERESVLAV